MTEIDLSNFVYRKVQVTFQNGKKCKGKFEYCHLEPLLSCTSFPYVFWGDNRKGDHYNKNGVNAFAEVFGNSHNIIQIEKIKPMTFNTDIQKTEKEIAVLQAKLDLLKEIEAHKSQPRMHLGKVGKFETVSYNDEFYVRMDYSYDILWYKSKNTKNFISNNLTLITDGETHRLLEGLWFNEVRKGKYDEQPTNWEPTPQTPEEVAEGLRSAMMKAKEDGVFDTPKKGTLYDIIADWWDEIFINNNPSGQNIESLIGQIEEWLPETFESYGEYQEGWNDCVENLRLKLK